MKILVQVSMILALFMTSQDSFSQFNKGRFIAGGSVRISSSANENMFSGNTTESKFSNFSLTPNVGYFVMNNLALGASVGLSLSKSTFDGDNSKATNASATIGPFIRYYLPVPVFFQAAAMFGSSRIKAYTPAFTPSEVEARYNVRQLGLAVGYAWLLNDFVALEPMLGYQGYTNKNKDTGDKATDGSLYLSCAFTIYLGERK